MAAGSISAPTIIPLRIPTSFSQSKLCIDTDTPIELSSPSPNVKIFYTLNGTKPNPFERDFKKSSTFPYTTPFTLSLGKHTIKTLAIAFDKQALSGIVTKVFTVFEPQVISPPKVSYTPEKPVVTKTASPPNIEETAAVKTKPISQEITQVAKPSILTSSPKIPSRPNSGRPTSGNFLIHISIYGFVKTLRNAKFENFKHPSICLVF